MSTSDNNDNPIAKLQTRQLTERMNELKNSFAAMDRNLVRTMPEAIFVAHFLPMFSGEVVANPADLISLWYNIAGTSYSPVNIVDAKGVFVIQVPPIHNNKSFGPIVDRNQDISYAVKHAVQKSSLSPRLGTNILAEELSLRLETMLANGDDTEVVQGWLDLFKHYKKIGKDVSIVVKPSADDEFEY